MTTYTEKEELRMIYSDMHKECYGVRSYLDPELSVEEMREAVADLRVSLDLEFELEQARKEEAVASFKASLTNLMNIGASSEQQAIEWLVDAYKEERGYDFLDGMDSRMFLYDYDLDYTKYGEETLYPIIYNIIKEKHGRSEEAA